VTVARVRLGATTLPRPWAERAALQTTGQALAAIGELTVLCSEEDIRERAKGAAVVALTKQSGQAPRSRDFPLAQPSPGARTGWLWTASFNSLLHMDWLAMNPSTVVLARGELVSMRLKGWTWHISCVAGRLWVTGSGRREDFVLTPGEKLTFEGRGKVVVEALRTATVRVETRMPAHRDASTPFPLWRLSTSLFQ